MRRIFTKLKHELNSKDEHANPSGNDSDGAAAKNSVHDARMPNEYDIYRYRKQRGVNIGSWFVLERWISPTPFNHAASPGQSDLDVARGPHAKEVLEKHWENWITDEDWVWLAGLGVNAVRIPIGYYHLCGADRNVLKGTDFESYYEVYEGAWRRIVDAVRKAAGYGIGVLIDLHAAPGKQNADSHSGTSSSNPTFFSNPYNQKHTIYILKSLLGNLSAVTQLCSPPLYNIIGIELLNEPHPPSDDALTRWYVQAMKEVRAMDDKIPIYLGECWRTGVYADFVAKHSGQGSGEGMVVLDHHLYRCFTAEDISTSVEEITRGIADPNGAVLNTLKSASEKMGRAGGGVVVGEWSGALNPGSLRGLGGGRGENEAKRRYVEAQLGMFERCCAGWFFWTFKKEKRGDTGWSFKDAVGSGVFPDFVGVRNRNMSALGDRSEQRDGLKNRALDAHTQYWSQHPGSYDHSLFEAGFLLGWDDAYRFIRSTPPSAKTVNQIGFTGAWAKKRGAEVLDLKMDKGKKGKQYWEFEQGIAQGVDAAMADYQACDDSGTRSRLARLPIYDI